VYLNCDLYAYVHLTISCS